MEPWTIQPQPTEAFYDAGRPAAAVKLSPLAFQIMAHYQADGVVETEAPEFFRVERVERPLPSRDQLDDAGTRQPFEATGHYAGEPALFDPAEAREVSSPRARSLYRDAKDAIVVAPVDATAKAHRVSGRTDVDRMSGAALKYSQGELTPVERGTGPSSLAQLDAWLDCLETSLRSSLADVRGLRAGHA